MEFIPSAPLNWPVTVLFLVCILALLGGVPLLGFLQDGAKGTKRKLLEVVMGVTILTAGLGAVSIYFFYDDPKAVARHEAVVESLDSYGLDLSKEERMALEYPRDRPKSDFEVFGSFTREGPTAEGFSRETVYLIWKGDLLHLAASPDGEQFAVLDPTD